MSVQEPSKTALGVAMLRAEHQLNDETPKILDDQVILKLLDPSIIDTMRSRTPSTGNNGTGNTGTNPQASLRAHVVIRSRYAEDRLLASIERGIRQYVLLGAGLDTFPYRQPPTANVLKIFEVDQPASQRDKQQRLQRAGIDIPSNVTLVPIDFERTSIADGLQSHTFDPTQRTFVSWLGVMVYLSRDAVDAVLKFVASLPKESEIVFSFTQPTSSQCDHDGNTTEFAERAAKLGEPWKTFVTQEDLERDLRNLGFSRVVIPTPEEIDEMYVRHRKDGLPAPKRASLASAVV